MEKLKLMNFRSINDSGDIDLKPITVFLGKNSCGKSSFIRMFPLIKQSLEVDIQEPLLWYGNYVDFGDYNNILPKSIDGESEHFKLEFDLKLLDSDMFEYGDFRNMMFRRFVNPQDKLEEVDIRVGIEFRQKYIYSLEVKYFDQSFYCSFDEDNNISKCIINGSENLDGLKNYKIIKSKGDFLQNFIYQPKGENDKYNKFYAVQEGEFEPIAKIFENDLKTRAKKEAIVEFILKSIWLQPKIKLLNFLKDNKSLLSIKNYFENKDINDEVFKKVNNQMLLIIVSALIGKINFYLDKLFSNTYYLKPLRAHANRYYRVQGISVKKVDADGSNLPMILYNMTEEKQNEFSNWCCEQLGLRFSIKKQEGHVSLMVFSKDNYEINLADAGYGYSQVLPIILQLWLLIDRNSHTTEIESNKNFMVIIEQPELHLHPAFQAKLIDVFVSLVELMNLNGNRIKIIFETHSDHMVNRLGRLISEGKIKKNDVNIVLVSKDNNISDFKQTSFDENGFIAEWPIGFMSPED